MIDVVYPIGKGSIWGDNNELRFSLRALEKNFLDLGKVYIIGEKPKWLNGEAIHIPAPDSFSQNKDANIITKILVACGHPRITSQFVRCSDDELFIAPVRYCEMKALYSANIQRVISPRNIWKLRIKNTCSYLRRLGKPSLFYDNHVPVPMDTMHFVRIMQNAPFAAHYGLAIDSLYFNMLEIPPKSRLRKQVARLHKRRFTVEQIRHRAQNAMYLNFNNDTLSLELKMFLIESFSRRSRFERDRVKPEELLSSR